MNTNDTENWYSLLVPITNITEYWIYEQAEAQSIDIEETCTKKEYFDQFSSILVFQYSSI